MVDTSFEYYDLVAEERFALIYEDFSIFTQRMFEALHPGTKLVWHDYLDLICARLQAVAHGQCRNLIITMPPRHLKSFCVSIALPAFVHGHYPGQHIMCVSYGQDLAKEFGAETLKVMNSQLYIEAFGKVLLNDRQRPGVIRTRQGGVRRATSVDGAATGLGADLLTFDDVQKAGETLSDAIRRATNTAYEQTFLSRRNMPTNARTVIVMQRLHQDDFVGHVLELGGDWEVINLPAIAEEDQAIAFETFLGPRVYRRKAGQALHPGRVPLEELALIRKASGEAVWASQYQQRPAPAGGGLVKLEWFKRYRDHELPSSFDRIVQSWDTANTTNEWSDYSVCTTWGVKGKHLYLTHVFRERLDFPGLRKAAIDQAQTHDATIVFIEDHGSGTQLYQVLRSENFGWARGVKPKGDKQTRMINQTAMIENGFVHIPVEAPWLDTFIDEVVMFPNSKFDDQINSMSQALDASNKWTEGRGLFEYYRQEAEAKSALEEEIWVLKSTIGPACIYGMDGTEYLPNRDGEVHLPRKDAAQVLCGYGWVKVG